MLRSLIVFVIAVLTSAQSLIADDFTQGYYRQPAIHGQTIVFVAEGDLWKVASDGGKASRLTTHHGLEGSPAISPDGKTLAFNASYEGPSEIYSMPLAGGTPTRLTYEATRRIAVAGFTPAGELVYATRSFSTLPDTQLVTIDLTSGKRTRIQLSQAAEAAFNNDGSMLYFTRLSKQGSNTKRYQGGTAQNIWKFAVNRNSEAIPLTSKYKGTSRYPMYYKGRVYFSSDRDGHMNLWSMKEDGSNLKQHTKHQGFDVLRPSIGQGRIVYQLGADLRLFDITTGKDNPISISLDSDFDQTREKWIEKPMDYLTAAGISPSGDRVALISRGEVFVAPHRQGRLVHVTRATEIRYSDVSFMPDGKSLLVISDESGELEFWQLPANGIGERKQLTDDGKVLRWEGVTSPDGKWIAHHDKNFELWLFNIETKAQTKIDYSPFDNFSDLKWSADSRWLAYVGTASNENFHIKLYDVQAKTITELTSDRYKSSNPVWGSDGKWIYFLSDRHLRSLVRSPWGTHQPEPYFDRKTKIYAIALQPGLRSLFLADDEVSRAEEELKEEEEKEEDKKEDTEQEDDEDAVEPIEIEVKNIQARLYDVPVKPGNYSNLMLTDDRLLFTALDDRHKGKRHLKMLKITNQDSEVKTLIEDINGSELSADRKKILVRKASKLYIIKADASAPAKLDKKDVKLGGWKFAITPLEEWRQMFVDAWRLERDYFYDQNMHGVDWPAMLDKYLPLVDRVRDRTELADLIAQMVAELSALHIFVYGGDIRQGEEAIAPASLGALLVLDANAGGHRIEHIYKSDPDEPHRRSPLARPDLDIHEGDVITMINGVTTTSVSDCGQLLRNQTGKQVLLHVVSSKGGAGRDVIVKPISQGAANSLRYDEWEYTRRLMVDEKSDNQIGYVHLRAMGANDIAQWARDYYPVFRRKGLIIDVRHNNGGNIDSWILEKLMRKAWFYWQGRVGQPIWNMQNAFRGHMVILCDERTSSDGEAITEGFRRLGLGKVIGTRTWGGEIWLSSSNRLVDQGIATAAEYGVYGPEGKWLIEGHGVDPDIVVDNYPHETFLGKDRQLEAAISHLQELILNEPIEVPPPPTHPDKSFKGNSSKR
ncbi:MAG: PD40 domain-containing protein [Planctomycetes bacterium]|nr:PD40 domain-containing protein [Planctomycetota bacterium]